MRISHQNTVTHLSLIVLTAALTGCTPETDLISTATDLGRPAPRINGQAGHFPSPVVNGTDSGGIEPDPQVVADESQGEAIPDSPVALALLGNAPNPFNPATELSFAVPAGGGSVTLVIHAVDGRRARRLVAAYLAGGEHTVIWRGRDDEGRRLPSGVYFASLSSGDEVRIRKLVMVQ